MSMTRTHPARPAAPQRRSALLMTVVAAAAVAGLGASFLVGSASSAQAAEAPVGLGTAESFAVLAGSTVTNTGPTEVSGDLGVSPGSAVTGFPPGVVVEGEEHAADAVALQAQEDVTTAYNDAANRTSSATVDEIGGLTLVGGVYTSSSAMTLTGTVTLDAQGDPGTVFIFQAGSTLKTATTSTVALVNGTQACNVYWQVGSSATLGVGTTFVGTVLALTSISARTDATVMGRLLARNGAVTLDSNTITRPFCDAVPAPSETLTPSVPASVTPTVTPTPSGGATVTPTLPSGGPTDTAGGSEASSPTGAQTTTGGAGDAMRTGTASDSSDDVPVPVGRPDTGRGATSPVGPGSVWLSLALFAFLGAMLAGWQWSGRAPRGSHHR